MIRFIKINNLYDLENLYDLFISKRFQKRGRIQVGDYYFSVTENCKSYMILIEDFDRRKIANCIYARDWFESNILNIIENITQNLNKESL